MSDVSAFWDERFARPGFAYGDAPNDFLVEALPRLPRGRALSLGEGRGATRSSSRATASR